MLDDLREIRATLVAALRRFGKTETGAMWAGDMTNVIDPNLCAQVIGSIEAKLVLLESWLTGNWTPKEEVVVLEFITAWHTAEQTIERYRNRYPEEPYSDLAGIALTNHPIPDTPIPTRGDPNARTPLVPVVTDTFSSDPPPTIIPNTAPGPQEPSSEQ